MAYRVYSGPGDLFFNVSNSVGSRAANYWTDIMLVQYFIRNIYIWGSMAGWGLFSYLQEHAAWLPDPNKDFRELKITESWIFSFQRDMNTGGVPLVQDGRVSRGKDTTSETRFTIHSLNNVYRDFLGMNGEEDWMVYLLSDRSLPPLLQNELLHRRS